MTNQRSLKALDWLNVFLADIQGGVGPFLVIYLTSSLQWNPAQVGLVLTMAAIAVIALVFFWFFMPETKSTDHPVSSKSGLATLRE